MHELSMAEQELRSTQQYESGRDQLGRAFRVLEWMAEQPDNSHGVRQIASALDMQPSTISRLMSQLSALGLARRDEETSRYALGLELVRLGALASAKVDLVSIARPQLIWLTGKIDENSYLCIYDSIGRRMMRVDRVPSSNPLRYEVSMNQWIDVIRGASGQAILAFLPREEIAAIAAEGSSGVSLTDSVLHGLERARIDGYVCTRGQRTPGAVGIGSPIFDSRGKVAGDVFITIPESRFESSREQELGELVRTAAMRITEGIAGVWPLTDLSGEGVVA